MSKKSKVAYLREYMDDALKEAENVQRLLDDGGIYLQEFIHTMKNMNYLRESKHLTPTYEIMIPGFIEDIVSDIVFLDDTQGICNIYICKIFSCLYSICNILCKALVFIYEQEVEQ